MAFSKGLPAPFDYDELFPTGQIKMVIADSLMARTLDDLLVAIAKIAANTLKGKFPLSPWKIRVLERSHWLENTAAHISDGAVETEVSR